MAGAQQPHPGVDREDVEVVVRPAAGQRGQPGVADRSGGVLQERAAVGRPAVAQRVGRVRVPGEQDRSSRHPGTTARPRVRSPAAATTTAPAISSASPAGLGSAVPLTAYPSSAVMTAPTARTAVTSTAGASDSAVNQVATYAARTTPVTPDHTPPRPPRRASAPTRPGTAGHPRRGTPP